MNIPKEVQNIVKKFKENDFDAFIVGGCVRDLLIGRGANDWDIATIAKPDEIQKIFPDSFYENNFFTVTVRTESQDPKLKEIEITTFRAEGRYTNKRHPDEVKFAKTIEEDLSRRDFTVNAIAIGQKIESRKQKIEVIDPFGGAQDIKSRTIRTVGEASERFEEDALRMMRAVRLATTLDFVVEEKTANAIKENAAALKNISQERIRDEFIKIVNSGRAMHGIELLRELGLLPYIMPELEEGHGVGQNKHHIYTVWEHNLRALGFAVKENFSLQVRLASLLHDVGKPRVKQGDGPDSTFYNHEIVGAKMTTKILERLKFSTKDNEKITKLVRHHLFYYNVDEVGESSVRRLVRQMGFENMNDLLQVRMADRIGSGVPKAEPYKLRHLKYVIEKVSQDPISSTMLKVSGNDVIEILKIKPGPKIGKVLDILLGIVLENPKKNTKIFLEKEIVKLGKLKDVEIDSLAKKSKSEREKLEIKRDEMTKQKYWVT